MGCKVGVLPLSPLPLLTQFDEALGAKGRAALLALEAVLVPRFVHCSEAGLEQVRE